MSVLSKILPRLILVLGIAVAWVGGIGVMSGNALSLASEERQIAENEELKTYKNVISMYDDMINAHPDDITWYERKANAYFEMEEYRNYIAQCERIIKAFPDSVNGYEMLMGYYDSIEDYKSIFELYSRVPETLKNAEEISGPYREYEYHCDYLSGSRTEVEPLSGGYGVIEDDGLYGYVNSEGRIVIECIFEDAHALFEDTAAVKRDGEWFIVDLDGDRIHASKDEIEDLYSPSQGYALAKVEGAYGFYDEGLSNPQHFEYENASVFYNGVAAVERDGKWALIDTSFSQITDFVFDDVIIDFSGACSRGGFVFAEIDGSYQMLDLKGNRVGTESFEDAKAAHGGWIAVKQNGKWGFVNEEGTFAIECAYEDADSFVNGLAPVEKGGLWGFITAEGDVAVEPTFEWASYLSSNGVSAIDTGRSMRYIQFYKFTLEGE